MWQRRSPSLTISCPPQFFSDIPAARRFCARKEIFSRNSNLAGLLGKGKKYSLALQTLGFLFQLFGFSIRQPSPNSSLQLVPASNQCAGTWNIHLCSEEFIRFKSFSTLKRNSSTSFGAARFFFCSAPLQSFPSVPSGYMKYGGNIKNSG